VRNACFELILNFFEKVECTRETSAISCACGDQEMSTVTMKMDGQLRGVARRLGGTG
jgi:hypothetical protein